MKTCSILSELKMQRPPLLQEYGRFVGDIEMPVTCKVMDRRFVDLLNRVEEFVKHCNV